MEFDCKNTFDKVFVLLKNVSFGKLLLVNALKNGYLIGNSHLPRTLQLWSGAPVMRTI